jgi:hypothetical protein
MGIEREGIPTETLIRPGKNQGGGAEAVRIRTRRTTEIPLQVRLIKG